MYILLIDLNWGQKVETFSSKTKDMKEALLSSISNIRYPRLGVKSVAKIKSNLIYNPYKLCDITKLSRVYNVFYVSLDMNGVDIDVNIIKIKEGTVNITFTIVSYFKGGTYISQNGKKTPIAAIRHWARYLSWHYFSKEERVEIKKIVLKNKELNEIMEGLVWNFECSIFGNSLKVYIVKS